MEKVIKTLKLGAFIFCCSYNTAWNEYMTDEEKSGYTLEQVINGKP